MASPGVQSCLVDSHCHLADGAFDRDRRQVVERAREAGVSTIIAVGTGELPDNNRATVALAEELEGVFATVAVHPHEIATVRNGWQEELEVMWANQHVVAVGETGLDFYYQHSPAGLQEEAFRFFLSAARRFSLPVVVHCRDAFTTLITIMREEKAAEVGGVLHCFSGDWEQAKLLLDLDFDISISGIVTFKNASRLREVVGKIPLERMLVETDAPYLAPVPHRGKRNEPALVLETAQQIAEVKGVTLAEVCTRTSQTAERLFHLS